jgi:hypothetical protein
VTHLEALLLFNRSTYEEKASLFEQNEAYRESYLDIQHINDHENWYKLCCALIEKDEGEGSLLNNAFSIMGELKARNALLSVPSDDLRLKLFLHLKEKEKLAVEILNWSVKLQESIFRILPPDSKRIITQLTDHQFNKYKENTDRGSRWLGVPTKEFIEKLDENLQKCVSCGHEIEPRCKLLITDEHSAYHLMCNSELQWLDGFLN